MGTSDAEAELGIHKKNYRRIILLHVLRELHITIGTDPCSAASRLAALLSSSKYAGILCDDIYVLRSLLPKFEPLADTRAALQRAEQLRASVPPAVAAAAADISSQRSKPPGTKAAGTTGAAQQCDFVCPVTVFVSERVLGHDVALGHLSRHFITLIERDIAFPTDVIVSERVSICISPLADIFSTATGMKQFMQCLVDESFRSTSRCWRSCADLHPSAQGGSRLTAI